MRKRLGAFLGLVISATIFPAASQAVSFTGLGFLPGGISSVAAAVSADGSVVVGSASGQAFRWTSGGGMVGLGLLPGGTRSGALGVSADGSVVVGAGNSTESPTLNEAFRWTSDGGMVGLGDLPGGSFASAAHGVSADGSVVVGTGSSASGQEAFRWTSGGGMVGLGDLPGGFFFSEASGVSADGLVVVGTGSSASGQEAVRWTPGGGGVGLGSGSATAASADGSVVVGSGLNPFRWTSGSGMMLLNVPGVGVARAVSADGSIVVGENRTCSDVDCQFSFIWDTTNGSQFLNEVLTSDFGLDLTGWTLVRATGISADGLTIVGTGTHPGGQTEAWMAIIPEPETVLLVLTGLLGLAARRKRRA